MQALGPVAVAILSGKHHFTVLDFRSQLLPRNFPSTHAVRKTQEPFHLSLHVAALLGSSGVLGGGPPQDPCKYTLAALWRVEVTQSGTLLTATF